MEDDVMVNREIVVGTDGTAYATVAVRWAAQEAALRGDPLRIVLAHDTEGPGPHPGGRPGPLKLGPEWADAALAAAADAARMVDRGLDVRTRRVGGCAVPALLSAADGAGLLVVGSRGRGRFTSLLLGSVSQQVASAAPCAVAVVRGTSAGPVVVGSDGSDHAQSAMEFAFRLALEHHAPLLAVRAYYPPATPLGFGYETLLYSSDVLDDTAAAELSRELDQWRAEYPTVKVRTSLVHGGAANALVARSRHARAVVVGSHGHGQLVGTLTGSVGLQLLHHAQCPVVLTHVGRPG